MSRHARTVVCVALSLSLGLGPMTFAHADKAKAVELFNDAKKLMDAGKYTDACPKLEAAKGHDPSADGIVLRLAACYEKTGKWASAWSHYVESASRAEKSGNKERLTLAKKGVADTETKLSRVTVKVASGAKVPGFEVKWDGKDLTEGEWGSALPVDPGDHSLTATAPGHTAFSTTVTVGAESKAVEVPKLTPAATAPSTAPVPAPTGAPTLAPTGTSAPPVMDKPPSKAPAITALATGSVLVIGGIATYVFGVRSARDDYFDTCGKQTTPTCENDAGKSKVRLLEGISYGALGLGLLGAGTGIYLLARSNSSGDRTGGVHTRVYINPLAGGAHLQVIADF